MAGWTLAILLVLQVAVVKSSTLYQWIVDSKTSFNYDPNPSNMLGVYNWPRTYSEDCGGQHQSPIDIQTNLVRYGVTCQCPRMIYPSNILRGTFKNNGHSAEFEPESELMLQLTNVPHRSGMYKLHDFHLHYGGVTGRDFELQGLRFRGSGIMSAGSEHTIDGLRFEGELHFVFYNDKYADLEEADNKTDGVVVMVFLIQKIPAMMAASGETSRFSEFLEANIPRIFPYQMNASTEVDMTIFFNRDCEFYTYPGSTTTPTCHESVRWIILKDPIMVTERAWFTLTGLQSRGDFNSRFGNYRTTQPLNDRIVEANFPRPNDPVLPSPNGESLLMMMMDIMNMTMDMMIQNSQVSNLNGNLPSMISLRNALSPQGNVRDIPLMMLSMMQNSQVPNLNGNVRERPMMSMMQNSQVPNLNGNVRDRPMMSMMQNSLVPNLNGNVREIPMMSVVQNAQFPNLNGNVRDRPMMVGPQNSDTGGNVRRMQTPQNGNTLAVPRTMTMIPEPNIPNLNGNGMAMPRMMTIPPNMNENAEIRNRLNNPNIPNLVANSMASNAVSMQNSGANNVQGGIRQNISVTNEMKPEFMNVMQANTDISKIMENMAGTINTMITMLDSPNIPNLVDNRVDTATMINNRNSLTSDVNVNMRQMPQMTGNTITPSRDMPMMRPARIHGLEKDINRLVRGNTQSDMSSVSRNINDNRNENNRNNNMNNNSNNSNNRNNNSNNNNRNNLSNPRRNSMVAERGHMAGNGFLNGMNDLMMPPVAMYVWK